MGNINFIAKIFQMLLFFKNVHVSGKLWLIILLRIFFFNSLVHEAFFQIL